jgi:hypothetical protein
VAEGLVLLVATLVGVAFLWRLTAAAEAEPDDRGSESDEDA